MLNQIYDARSVFGVSGSSKDPALFTPFFRVHCVCVCTDRRAYSIVRDRAADVFV